MDQPIINALIAVFLALGTAVSDDTVHRAGDLLRDLMADGVVDRDTQEILESLLVAVDHSDKPQPPLWVIFEQLETLH
jgi:hypothetical protein